MTRWTLEPLIMFSGISILAYGISRDYILSFLIAIVITAVYMAVELWYRDKE